MRLVPRAADIAYRAHKGQFRKFGHSMDPYVLHPMRVAGLVMLAKPEHMTDEIVAAAWLHDVIEDTEWGVEHLAEAGIPDGVLDIVKVLTRKKPDRRPRKARVDEMVDKVSKAPWAARIVKLADRVDNLTDMYGDPKAPQDFIVQYASEARRLADALRGTDPFLEARLAILVAGIEQMNA